MGRTKDGRGFPRSFSAPESKDADRGLRPRRKDETPQKDESQNVGEEVEVLPQFGSCLSRVATGTTRR